jgi:CxxC-x17-CxxC domain-containing protein
MENLRDEHIACASCGASFLFSAGEAAVFAQRGLALPKRCKECRRARKEQQAHADGGGQAHRAPGGFPGRGPDRGAARPPRYTGDVNEYRSPMQDRSFVAAPAPFAGPRTAPRPPRGHAPSFREDGIYRAPSSHNGRDAGAQRPAARPPRNTSQASPSTMGPQAAPDPGLLRSPPGGHGEERSPGKRRPQAETFSIVCNACGQSAEVPFRPAEGREVFCQACYRARKPS